MGEQRQIFQKEREKTAKSACDTRNYVEIFPFLNIFVDKTLLI